MPDEAELIALRAASSGDAMIDHLPGRPVDHVGWWVWQNGAEYVWLCAEDCPHDDHDDHDDPKAKWPLICSNCGASASLPLGMSCSDHRPVRTPPAPQGEQP